MILAALRAIFGRKPAPLPAPRDDRVGALELARQKQRLKALDAELDVFRR